MTLARAPRRYPRLALSVAAFVERAAVLLGGRRLYRRSLRRPRLRVVTHDVDLTGLDPRLDGLRVVHLSDFHAGPFLDAAALDDVIATANAAAPDVVALTGDFITHRADEGVALAGTFGRLEARLGAFAVFGNHDYRARREGEMEDAFARVGVTTLRNRGVAVERDGARVWIAGIEDVEEGKVVDLDAALAGRAGGDATILLAHHPDVADDLGGRAIDLVLAGHTHGGQIRLFGRSILGTSLRSRYRAGIYHAGSARLHVTRGIGVLVLPLRVGAPAEVAVLTLRRA